MECNFQVGQKIVCTMPQAVGQRLICQDGVAIVAPVCGTIYTVREVRIGRMDNGEQAPNVLLVELVNPPVHCMFNEFTEVGWHHQMFKPLDERKTDISIFTKMLTPTKMRELV